MDQFDYGIFDGSLYMKAPEAKFTYVFCKTVHDFIHSIMGNTEVANVMAHHACQIISLLKVKSCRLIEPIIIDYNFIEVLPRGTCFDIENKSFVKDPKNLKGMQFVCFSSSIQK